MSLQSRLLKSRRHADLSQAQLAAKVGVHRSAVSHWETHGTGGPSLSHLVRVAEITGVRFEWLATGHGSITLSPEAALDAVAAVRGELIDDALEVRLIHAFREMPGSAQVALMEIVEQLAMRSGGRARRRNLHADV